MKCKKCGKELTQEMIDVNLCWSCGDIINENFVEQDMDTDEPAVKKDDHPANSPSESDDTDSDDKNIIGTVLFGLGIVVLVLGTIGSFVLANDGGFQLFAIYEFATILSGFMLMGFAEIIKLLAKINSKLK